MDDLHPERLRAPADLGADPSHPDEPERRAGEVVPEPFRPRPAGAPAGVADEPVRRDELPAGRRA
jgi:hypothetical protein